MTNSKSRIAAILVSMIATTAFAQSDTEDPVYPILFAEGMFGCASLAFGEGEFDHHSIYATTTTAQGRGGKFWRVQFGVGGSHLYR